MANVSVVGPADESSYCGWQKNGGAQKSAFLSIRQFNHHNG